MNVAVLFLVALLPALTVSLACRETRTSDISFTNPLIPALPTQTPFFNIASARQDMTLLPNCWSNCGQTPSYVLEPYLWHDAYTDGNNILNCSTPTVSGAASVTLSSTPASATYAASYAFDTNGGSYFSGSKDGSGFVYLAYAFASPVTLHRYAVTTFWSGGTGEHPTTWDFQGSSDGSTWTTVNSQTGIQFWTGQTIEFLLDSGATFSYFRLFIKATRGTAAVRASVATLAFSTCDTSAFVNDPSRYATRTSTNDRFFLSYNPGLPTLSSSFGPVTLPYTVSFDYRQHYLNGIENNNIPSNITFNVYLVRSGYSPQNRTFIRNGQWDLPIVPVLVNGVEVESIPLITKSTTWTTLQYTFYLTESCVDCDVLLSLEHESWPSYWGSKHYFSNFKITSQPQAIPSRVFVSGANNVAQVRKAPTNIPTNPRTSCPHLDAGLKLWHDASTWTNGIVPAAGSSVVLPENSRVLVKSCTFDAAVPYQLIDIPATSELIFDDADIVLNTKGIIVRGKLSIGSPTCRLFSNIEIVFHGVKSSIAGVGSLSTTASKGLVAVGAGVVEVHGKQYITWTKLTTTAFPNDDRVFLQDAVNWEPGQKVAVITTIWRDEESNQNEEMEIKSVDSTGKIVQFTSVLAFKHYAGTEYQAEVVLLSRRVKFTGNLADSESDKFGGHTLITGTGQGRFSGVEAYRMGQLNLMGRYPFHLHLLGSSPSSYFKDCSVHHSYFRCYTIHGTNNSLVSQNVAFDVMGHCFYLEDGVEENNVFEYNLAAFVHTIFRAAAGGVQSGEIFVQSPDLINPADTSASGFYISNAFNRFYGNAASGGWAGFAFPGVPLPLGAYRGADYGRNNPIRRPLLEFDGNSAHSSGYLWWSSGCIYIGGVLQHQGAAQNYSLIYNSGRNSRDTVNSTGHDVSMLFTNNKVFLCSFSLNHWGNRLDVSYLESHDVIKSCVIFGKGSLSHSLVNAVSGNNPVLDTHQGFEFYDTWTNTVLYNITFRNFKSLPDNVFSALTHSDTFKPQFISAVSNIKYENVARKTIITYPIRKTGSAWQFNFLDVDGSATLRNKPTIVGSHVDWWNLGTPDCVKDSDWGVWLCDKTADRDIVHLEFEIPGITRTEAEYNTAESHRPIGMLKYATDSDYTRGLIVSKNPGYTGVGKTQWHLNLYAGAPRRLTIPLLQIPRSSFIILAIPYPPGTQFNVYAINRWYSWPQNYNHSIPQASSLAQLLDNNENLPSPSSISCPNPSNLPSVICNTGTIGPKWFFDGSNLYLRIVDMIHYVPSTYVNAPNAGFVRFGVRIPDITNAFIWNVEASCTPLCASSPVCPLVSPTCIPTDQELLAPLINFCPGVADPEATCVNAASTSTSTSTTSTSTSTSTTTTKTSTSTSTKTTTTKTTRTTTTPDVTKPTAPLNFKACVLAKVSAKYNVTLSWSPASDNVAVTNYLVYRDNTLVKTLTASVQSFSQLVNNKATAYEFEVAARDARNNLSTRAAMSVLATGNGPWPCA